MAMSKHQTLYVGAQNDITYLIDAPPSPAPYDGPIPKEYGPNAVAKIYSGYEALAPVLAAAPDMLAALRKAEQFIRNGIELGYIRMPDAGTPDSAHNTPPMIRAAIAKAEGVAS